VKIDKTRPKVTVPKGPPPKKLVVRDLEEGAGPPAKYGDELTIMYAARYYTTGKPFSASWDWGKPTTFELGAGKYDAGWETGLPGMRVGGRRELIVPGGFTGRTGFPPGSGPEDTLVYVVDLFAIN
jgi:peptidylprolyl isomerase